LVMIQAIGAFRVFGTPIIGMSFKRITCDEYSLLYLYWSILLKLF